MVEFIYYQLILKFTLLILVEVMGSTHVLNLMELNTGAQTEVVEILGNVVVMEMVTILVVLV